MQHNTQTPSTGDNCPSPTFLDLVKLASSDRRKALGLAIERIRQGDEALINKVVANAFAHQETIDWYEAKKARQQGKDTKGKDERLTKAMTKKERERNAAARKAEFEALKCSGLFDLPKHPIKSRDDLTFTIRDENNGLINWHVKHYAQYWENGIALGERFFNEVIELARANPEDAYHALTFVWDRIFPATYGEHSGFMRSFARAAVAGILAHPEGLPVIDDD